MVLDHLTERLPPLAIERQSADRGCVGQNERGDAIGVGRGVHGAETGFDLGDQRHALHPHRVEHRFQIIHLLLERQWAIIPQF